jgi:hypothetical protein
MDRINKEGARKHADKGKELLAPGSNQDLEAAISEYSKAIFRELACGVHLARNNCMPTPLWMAQAGSFRPLEA